MDSDILSVDGAAAADAFHDAAGVGRNREEEEGGEVVAAVEGVEDRPVGLLDLPDETLLLVYETLLSSYRLPEDRHWRDTQAYFLLPLAPTLVNRRIFRLATPVRHRILFVDRNFVFPASDSFRKSLQVNLQHLEVVCREFPQKAAPLLATFKTLRLLRLDCLTTMSPAIVKALAGLTQLEQLHIAPSNGEFDRPNIAHQVDDDFTFAEVLPFVRTLEVGSNCRIYDRFLRPESLRLLRSLELHNRQPLDFVPWSSLERLMTRPRKGYFSDWDVWIYYMEQALETGDGINLKHLVIEVDTISPDRSEDEEQGQSYEEGIPHALEFFQQVDSLEALEFRGFEHLRWEEETPLRLNSVRTLRLEEVKDLRLPSSYELNNHPCVLDFLVMFPSLSTFHLAVDNLLSSSTVAAIKLAASNPLNPSLPSVYSLLERERDLLDLLDGLHKTQVLNFRYRTKCDSTVELRFWREREGEGCEFVGEWWWL